MAEMNQEVLDLVKQELTALPKTNQYGVAVIARRKYRPLYCPLP